jgi:hypothetical protein
VNQIRRVVLALLLAAATPGVADTTAELLETQQKLEQLRDQWTQERQKFVDRLDQKRAELRALENTPQERQQLQEKANKALADVMKTSAKGIPTAVGRDVAKKAVLAKDVGEGSVEAQQALGELHDIDMAEVSGKITNDKAVVNRQIVDLQNKIAIYNAFIKGVNTSISQVGNTISAQRTHAWSEFTAKLGGAMAAAEKRVGERREAERREAERKAAEEKARQQSRSSGGGAGGDRPDRPRGGGSNNGNENKGNENKGNENKGNDNKGNDNKGNKGNDNKGGGVANPLT